MDEYCKQKIVQLKVKNSAADVDAPNPKIVHPESFQPVSDPDQMAFCGTCIRRLRLLSDDAHTSRAQRDPEPVSATPPHPHPRVAGVSVGQVARLRIEAILHKLRSQTRDS